MAGFAANLTFDSSRQAVAPAYAKRLAGFAVSRWTDSRQVVGTCAVSGLVWLVANSLAGGKRELLAQGNRSKPIFIKRSFKEGVAEKNMEKIKTIRFCSMALVLFCLSGATYAQVKIAKLKYNGGGDWYANKTALPNLIKFCNTELGMDLSADEDDVEVGSKELFLYPYVYMTGHGNVTFSPAEAQNLRSYLLSGGFLHIDDNYGLDKFIRIELKKVFPELELIELPFDHPIYHQKYNFQKGLPKIHEHDGKPAQGFGLVYEGRLIVYYTFECDLGNGWEDQRIYNDPEAKRELALQMGANILTWCVTHLN